MNTLQIGGITPLTTIDFPDKLSAVIYVRGCPWKCPYCQNKDLQTRSQPVNEKLITWSDVEKFLDKRKGLLDGVVFSGGEPLLDPKLKDSIQLVKTKGYAVGLHTAGIYPLRLQEILPMLDWVGLDIKAPVSLSKEKLYRKITGWRMNGFKTLASLCFLLASGIDYEIRTTVHPHLLSEAQILELAQELKIFGVQNYALQIYHRPPQIEETEGLPEVEADYPREEILQRLQEMFQNFTLRR